MGARDGWAARILSRDPLASRESLARGPGPELGPEPEPEEDARGAELRERSGWPCELPGPDETGPVDTLPGEGPAVDPSARRRLLVVDDDPDVAEFIVWMLAPIYDLVVENDPCRALDRLRAGGAFDLVLCDVSMTPMTGPQLYQTVLEERPEYAPRFLFVTAGATEPESAAFISHHMHAVLLKPFSVAAARARIAAQFAALDGVVATAARE